MTKGCFFWGRRDSGLGDELFGTGERLGDDLLETLDFWENFELRLPEERVAGVAPAVLA